MLLRALIILLLVSYNRQTFFVPIGTEMHGGNRTFVLWSTTHCWARCKVHIVTISSPTIAISYGSLRHCQGHSQKVNSQNESIVDPRSTITAPCSGAGLRGKVTSLMLCATWVTRIGSHSRQQVLGFLARIYYSK